MIEVNRVTKNFRLGESRSLHRTVLDAMARLRGASIGVPPCLKALSDVDFKIDAGEVVGIIGYNGAGKSTLLKILAGISNPTFGSVRVRGRVAPLIEVGTGLVPELTGRENIYLNGAILGMKRSEIARKFSDIVAFADLEQFVDTPIKRYSTGMQVRLAFSIATAVDSELLILDEVLAVGDLAFQRKCFDRMEDLIRRRGNTVLLVSHNLRQVERLCSRVLLLDKGRLIADGAAPAVCNEYYRRSDAQIVADKHRTTAGRGRFETSDELDLLACEVLDEFGQVATSVAHGSDMAVRITFRLSRPLSQPVFGIGFHTTDFVYLSTSHSTGQLDLPWLQPGEHKLICRFAKIPLLPGGYSIRVGIAFGAYVAPIFYGENLARFQVTSRTLHRVWASAANEGFFAVETDWRLQSAPPGGDAHCISAEEQHLAAGGARSYDR